jgi:FkbM family methyltransferase
MRLAVKKALRSAQVAVPQLQEARFSLHLLVLRAARRPWRPDAEAVRFVGMDDPMIVDVGANRGFSIAGFLTLKPRARIVAFEPLPKLAARLQERYHASSNVTVHPYGLGTADADMAIYIPVYRGWVFDPLAALDYEGAAAWVNSERFYFFDARKLTIQKEQVEIRRLDDFKLSPDIIKIYAQGHEPAIIQGGEATIRRCEPAIMAPARIPAIDACLRDLGYVRHGFSQGRFHVEGEGHSSSWWLRPKHIDLFRCAIDRAVAAA